MSELWVNGTSVPADWPRGTSVGEIVRQGLEGKLPRAEIVCQVLVDEDPTADLEERRWGELDRLELRTAPPEILVRRGLEASEQVLAELSDGLQGAVRELRAGDRVGFQTRFVPAVDALLSFISFLARATALSGEHQPVVERFQRQIQLLLEQMLTALERQDHVLMADLTEYELVPLFEGWSAVRAALQAARPPEVAHA
jgi:hypothetical protein